jgi:outer membrane protein OmpA-like peptidoglycan-associated protein
MKTTYLLLAVLSCNIVLSQDYLDKQPENPEPGKCYAKCVTPDEFEEETIVVESIPSYNKLEIVPAVYKTVLSKVILKPSTKKFINVPAIYKTVVDTVWTKEPYHKITIEDAEFEFIDKEVEVLASRESWVAGEKDPDCPSIDPNDCRIFHYRKDPPVTRNIPVSKVKTAASTQKTKIRGNYKLVKRNVEVSPATTVFETIPAITEQISRKVVVTDEATRVTSVAAEHINVTKRVLVKKGGMTAWKIVPCTIPTRVGVVPIYYSSGSAVLTQESKRLIDKHIWTILQSNSSSIVEIGSHTDSQGSANSNLKLSERRAKVVVDYLVKKGASSERLIAVGYGENKLLNECDDSKKCSNLKHKENRRTEFKVF